MKNDILNPQFLDFSIVALKEPQAILQKCEGSNQKKLLVVFDITDDNPEQYEFLKKILAAAQFDIEKDILLLKITDKDPFSFFSLKANAANHFGDIENMLTFGLSPRQFGLNLDIQNYSPLHFNGCGFLFADSLEQLGKNKNLKAALWQGMQKLFLK